MIRLIKKTVSKTIDWIVFTLFNEKQKKAISNLFTDKQKDILRKFTRYGKKHEQKQYIKQLKHHLYTLGFTDKALSELKTCYTTANDPYMKRLAAWELAQWYANKYTQEDARQALAYLAATIEGEADKNQLRRVAIIKAESYDLLNQPEQGKKAIHETLQFQKHPDLYLACANLEETMEARTKWMNKAMEMYSLQPIEFQSQHTPITYDDLRTMPMDKKIENGPKVSVILPAFNAEDGISTAMESILSQTWENIELLVVDDCSTDHTKDVVREYMKNDSRITLLSTPANSGPYVARNVALKAATGEFITINDSDDWSHAEKIEIQANHLQKNKKVIANTSEHARLTEELKLYRRGTPSRYIFSNMSSLMFRRKQVFKKLGYWDSVRFAADGEFKRRLIKIFGKTRFVDLKTGPLSLPRQSVASLTGSSAFGYNGFFKGVRKEYVESLEHHHSQADSLYYSFPQGQRPFSVPEPMWPEREEKLSGTRYFDVVIASDFRKIDEGDGVLQEIKNVINANKRVGLIQMYHYDLGFTGDVSPLIRNLLNGIHLQMLVYGENIHTDKLIIMNPSVLEDWQQYIPNTAAEEIQVMADIVSGTLDFERCLQHIYSYFGSTGTWYTDDLEVEKHLKNNSAFKIKSVNVTSKDRKKVSDYVRGEI